MPVQWSRADTPVPAGFARRFLTENRWRVLLVLLAEGSTIWNAANGRWISVVFWSVMSTWGWWQLIERAAGVLVPAARSKPIEEMTPREAFWLDPASVFNRERRHNRAS